MSKAQSNNILYGLVAVFLVGLVWALVSYFTPKSADAKPVESSINKNDKPLTASVTPAVILPTASSTAATTANNQPISLQKRLDLINQRNPNLKMTAGELQALMNKPEAWQVQDDMAEQLKDKLEPGEEKDGRKFIALDTKKIETLLPNDTMQVNIPQLGKTYNLKVDGISTENGITSWSGKLTDFPDINTVSITQGGTGTSQITQIGLNTPVGYYVLEGFGNAGWVIPGGTQLNNKGEIVVPVDENGVAQTPEVYPGNNAVAKNETPNK